MQTLGTAQRHGSPRQHIQVKLFMNNSDAELSSLDVEVLRQFRVIFKSVRKHFNLIESMAGVSGAQLWALHAISSRPGLRVTELSKAMSIHQSTASNLVEKLVENGYVERKKGVEDSRVVRLTLTALGQDRLKRAPGPVRGILPEALEQLPQETLLELNHALGALLAKMALSEEQDGGTPLSDM